MKHALPLILLSALFLTACGTQNTASGHSADQLIQPSETASPSAESSAEPSAESDPFAAFGQREADYTISEQQIVQIGDTIQAVNLMDFSGTSADFVSQAAVTLNAVQRVSDPTAINGTLIADEAELSKNQDWLLLSMTIENTGSAQADFALAGTVWSVPQNTMLAQTDDAHFWTAMAYVDNGTALPVSDDYLTLAAGQSVTVTAACPVAPNAPAANETLYWELNPHADSFFYESGRREVWFVELTQ